MATHDRENFGAGAAIISLAERSWAYARAWQSCVAAIVLSFALMSGATAAPNDEPSQNGTTAPTLHELVALLNDPKAHELLRLLADPKTREWLVE